MKNFYDILNSQQQDSIESIKKEYQLLALKCHPDKNRGPNNDSNQSSAPPKDTASDRIEFHHIDEAWKVLRDPVARRAYDAELNQHKFDEKGIVHSTLTIQEFDVDEENDAYIHLCRCGGYFVMPRGEDLAEALAADEDILINCDECSLVIKLAQ